MATPAAVAGAGVRAGHVGGHDGGLGQHPRARRAAGREGCPARAGRVGSRRGPRWPWWRRQLARHLPRLLSSSPAGLAPATARPLRASGLAATFARKGRRAGRARVRGGRRRAGRWRSLGHLDDLLQLRVPDDDHAVAGDRRAPVAARRPDRQQVDAARRARRTGQQRVEALEWVIRPAPRARLKMAPALYRRSSGCIAAVDDGLAPSRRRCRRRWRSSSGRRRGRRAGGRRSRRTRPRRRP